MKKILIISSVIFIAVLVIAIPRALQSKDGHTGFVKKVVLNLSKNAVMDYESTLVIEQEKRSLKGRLAYNEQGNLYDSSNTRLLLYNEKWMLNIDHESKMVDALYMPKVKGQLPDSTQLDFGNFHMNASFRSLTQKELDFKREEAPGGNYWLKSKSKEGADNIYEVNLLFNKENKLIEYKGTAQIPMDYDVRFDSVKSGYEQVPTQMGELSFRCYNIDTLQQGVFNEQRLIEYRGEGAYLKRYKKYKMFKN